MTKTGDMLLQKKTISYRPAVPVYTIPYNVPATGTQKQNMTELQAFFFGGLECVGHSFAYVAHL
jgi:hypothetical protein